MGRGRQEGRKDWARTTNKRGIEAGGGRGRPVVIASRNTARYTVLSLITELSCIKVLPWLVHAIRIFEAAARVKGREEEMVARNKTCRHVRHVTLLRAYLLLSTVIDRRDGRKILKYAR